MHSNTVSRAYDWTWLKKGGGMLTGEHVPVGQGQRRPEDPVLGHGRGLRAHAVRDRARPRLPELQPDARRRCRSPTSCTWSRALIAICLLAGHIYLGTIGMKGALEAMRTGYVDETWAKEHHEYWYNDVKSGQGSRRGESAGRRAAAPRATNGRRSTHGDRRRKER